VLEIKDEVPPNRVDLERVVIGSLSVPLEQPRSPSGKQHQWDGGIRKPYLKHAVHALSAIRYRYAICGLRAKRPRGVSDPLRSDKQAL
jgi:hypothetical protein